MNIIRSVIESLAGLDQKETLSLYNTMISRAGFTEVTADSDYVMYIFPDGRMLGTHGSLDRGEPLADGEDPDEEDFGRFIYHLDIYNGDSAYFTGGNEGHPLFNTKMAKYHNLVIVVPKDEEGAIAIPAGVEPTPEQQASIKALRKNGYVLVKPDDLDGR